MEASEEGKSPLEHVRHRLGRLLHGHHHHHSTHNSTESLQKCTEDDRLASSGDSSVDRLHSHLNASTSEAAPFPTTAGGYTLHEKVGKGSSSTVRSCPCRPHSKALNDDHSACVMTAYQPEQVSYFRCTEPQLSPLAKR